MDGRRGGSDGQQTAKKQKVAREAKKLNGT